MTNLNANEQELIQLFRNTDEFSRLIVIKILVCFILFEEDYYTEMKIFQDKGDIKGMVDCTEKWYAIGCEIFEIENVTI